MDQIVGILYTTLLHEKSITFVAIFMTDLVSTFFKNNKTTEIKWKEEAKLLCDERYVHGYKDH